ncbi:MAG: hypothetical protein EOP58_09345 [Sphingomonadales bacterium]|nr:MAG: hypothetical protein EOP58_09345 [Sphingomonadales bacterium]
MPSAIRTGRHGPADTQWWRLFDDPTLDRLVADALAHNTDVRAGRRRIDEPAFRTRRGRRADIIGADRAPADCEQQCQRDTLHDLASTGFVSSPSRTLPRPVRLCIRSASMRLMT